jgi:hypothetical protein
MTPVATTDPAKVVTEKVTTIRQAIYLGITATKNASNFAVAEWLDKHYPKLVKEFHDSHKLDMLAKLIGTVRTDERKAQVTISRQACLDLGMEPIELDEQISRPRDPKNPIYGGTDYTDFDDGTIRLMREHAAFLRQQAAHTVSKAENWERYIQKAFVFADGDIDMPNREIRRRAKQASGAL